MQQQTLTLSHEEMINLTSLLTYCKNFHPDIELKNDANDFLIKMYQMKLFDDETWNRQEKPKRSRNSQKTSISP
jgi:hypothetical protein